MSSYTVTLDSDEQPLYVLNCTECDEFYRDNQPPPVDGDQLPQGHSFIVETDPDWTDPVTGALFQGASHMRIIHPA